jgi:outer membrane protein assembly factor BamA
MRKKAILVFSSSLLICLFTAIAGRGQHLLRVRPVDKDSAFVADSLQLQMRFDNQFACIRYIDDLPALLRSKGFPTASIDSVISDTAQTLIQLYLGRQYQWMSLRPSGIEAQALLESRFSQRDFIDKPIDLNRLQQIQKRILRYYDNIGYPFAQVYLDSPQLQQNQMQALLKVNPGVQYHIDSIRVFGKGKIRSSFLQQYLNIRNGSLFSRDKLEKVSGRLLELPFIEEVQPSDLTLLGSGAILNLYLQPKRSSQVNFLIGFLPANNETGKLQLTGDVNLNLRNVLSAGETILLNWQQLQVQSPRLNLGYQQPYLFNSAFGIDFAFGLFKKDSTFLQLNAQLGIQYLLSARQSGKLYIQNQSTFLLAAGADTNFVKQTKRLPPNIDVSAIGVGLDYEWNNTNYRLNPRKGNECSISVVAGLKTIKPNTDILNLKEQGFDYARLYDSLQTKTYQLRVRGKWAHYFPLGRTTTLRTSVTAGLFSSQNIFRNELFQIGGYRLLRGFDEESIFATRYAVASAEYRILVALNSYFFGFADAGRVVNRYQLVNQTNNFISGGLGLAFETRTGLLNISYALGKRDDLPFNLRQASKIHFGYVNYF